MIPLIVVITVLSLNYSQRLGTPTLALTWHRRGVSLVAGDEKEFGKAQ